MEQTGLQRLHFPGGGVGVFGVVRGLGGFGFVRGLDGFAVVIRGFTLVFVRIFRGFGCVFVLIVRIFGGGVRGLRFSGVGGFGHAAVRLLRLRGGLLGSFRGDGFLWGAFLGVIEVPPLNGVEHGVIALRVNVEAAGVHDLEGLRLVNVRVDHNVL